MANYHQTGEEEKKSLGGEVVSDTININVSRTELH
jgi:hypothetical protein